MDRWQHDLWYRIALAHLEGHPEKIDLSGMPQLDRPARSRYGANTAVLRNWFKTFNEGKPLHEQVVSFNFLLSLPVSKVAYYQALANGELSDDMPSGIPAVAAPYSDNWKEAVANAFDRRTGKPVPASILKSYREAVSGYALHPEAKFENGSEFDRGLTIRRHVQAVAVEYIGKEANRWEEQFYLGEHAESAVEYGHGGTNQKRITDMLTLWSQKFGQSKLATQAGISRQELASILTNRAAPRLLGRYFCEIISQSKRQVSVNRQKARRLLSPRAFPIPPGAIPAFFASEYSNQSVLAPRPMPRSCSAAAMEIV